MLLLRGMPPSQIAKELYIAPGTVKAHIGHIYGKLGVHSRDELMDLVGTPSI